MHCVEGPIFGELRSGGSVFIMKSSRYTRVDLHVLRD